MSTQPLPPAYPPPPYPSSAPMGRLPPEPIPMTEQQLRWHYFGGWGTSFVVFMLMLFGGIFAAVVAYDMYRDHRFETRGATADGVIVSKRISKSTNNKGRTTTDHLVTYAFTDPAGFRRSAEEDVDSDHYHHLANVGRPHPVQYLPDDPSESRLVRDRGSGMWWMMGGIAALLLGIAFCVVVFGRRSARRRAHLLFHGAPRPGQVTLCETRGRGKNRRHLMEYRYMDLANQERKSKEVRIPHGMIARWPAGSFITVVLDPKDPSKHEPDLWCVRGAPAAG